LLSYHDIHNNLSALPYFLCIAGAGAAIAPPPSLTETSEPPGQDNDDASGNKSRNASRGLDVAAKIMAKYGYKVSFVAYATNLEITPQKFGVQDGDI